MHCTDMQYRYLNFLKLCSLWFSVWCHHYEGIQLAFISLRVIIWWILLCWALVWLAVFTVYSTCTATCDCTTCYSSIWLWNAVQQLGPASRLTQDGEQPCLWQLHEIYMYKRTTHFEWIILSTMNSFFSLVHLSKPLLTHEESVEALNV